jgi:hypothetical protein
MPSQLPPIAKLAERLMLDIEQAVRRFPRYHRYAVGAKLREQAFEVTTLTHRAWKEQARKHEWARQLVWAIDGLKISLQLCSQLKAFSSFRQFEALARLAHELGKQAGGWKKQLDRHRSGQNAQAESAFAQRAQELSTHGASAAIEAYP